MDYTTLTIILVVVLVLIMAGTLIILKEQKTTVRDRKKANAIRNKKLLKKYDNFCKNFLTSDVIAKISKKINDLSVYSKEEVKMCSVAYCQYYIRVVAIVNIISLFMFKDMISIMITFALSFELAKVLVNKKIANLQEKIYVQLKDGISSVRQEYLKLGSIPEALQSSEYGNLVQKIFDEINTILTTKNGEILLEEFYEKVPYRIIQTFATVCYTINNTGDSKDETGQSNFVQALTLLANDIIGEMDKMDYLKRKFGSVEYLSLIPFVANNIVEWYFKGQMPGTSLVYNSPLGYACRLGTMLISLLVFSIIAKINSPNPIELDDRNETDTKLVKIPTIKGFIDTISPKNKKAQKINLMLKDTMSKLKIDTLYMRKVRYSLISFFISIVVIVCATQFGRSFILNNTQSLSLVATNEMDDYEPEAIQALDLDYMAQRDAGVTFTDDEMFGLIKGTMTKLSDMQVYDQIKRLEDKYNSYKNSYFKWWYIWVCALIGVAGWFWPNAELLLRKKLINTEKQNDFLQLQTLMTIIMNTGCDTLEAIEQLYKSSDVYQDILLYCYHNYPSDPKKELERLISKVEYPDFKRFIGKLKSTVDDISLSDAFSDLLMERNYIVTIKDRAMKQSIDMRRNLCGKLVMIPVWIMIISELLFPMGYLGFTEFTKALEQMNS